MQISTIINQLRVQGWLRNNKCYICDGGRDYPNTGLSDNKPVFDAASPSVENIVNSKK